MTSQQTTMTAAEHIQTAQQILERIPLAAGDLYSHTRAVIAQAHIEMARLLLDVQQGPQ
jgi:hypothetical protein